MHPGNDELSFIKTEVADMLSGQNLPPFLSCENVGILEQIAWLLFDRARLMDELTLHRYTTRINRNTIASDLANLYEEELKSLKDCNRQLQLIWDEERQKLKESNCDLENDILLLKNENEQLRAHLSVENSRQSKLELSDRDPNSGVSKEDSVSSTKESLASVSSNQTDNYHHGSHLEEELLRKELNSLHLRYIKKRERHKIKLHQAREYFQAECKKLEGSVATYHKQFLEEKSRANAMEKTLKQTNTTNWELRTKISEAEQELSSKDKKIQLLENRCLILESQMNNLMKELDLIGDERNRLSAELRNYTLVMNDSHQDVDDQSSC